MSSCELEITFKILTEHNFVGNKNVPNKYKCLNCKKILIDACRTRCGCKFCRNCVNEMINNGHQFCSGSTSGCKNESLKNFRSDKETNKKISKLKLKCPEVKCKSKCKLIKMNDHLKICKMKTVECPFNNVGCNKKEMTNKKLKKHFLSEICYHNKLLIDMNVNNKNEFEEFRKQYPGNHEKNDKLTDNLNTLKAEMEMNKADTLEKEKAIENIISELRDSDSKNHEKVNKLTDNFNLIKKEMETIKMDKVVVEERLENIIAELRDRDSKNREEINKLTENFNSIKKEMETIKEDEEELDGRLKIGLRNIWNKTDEIDSKNKEQCEMGRLESIKLNEKIVYLDNKCDENESKNKEIKSEIDDIRLNLTEMYSKTMYWEQNINQIERNVDKKMDGIFEMTINNINEHIWNKRLILSECFHVSMNPYKLRLHISPSNGLLRFSRDFMCIHLCIYDDVVNRYLSFPFKAEVTMKIINKNKRNVSQSINKCCQIKKPKTNSIESSDEFKYFYLELSTKGVLESNCIIVQCSVELKCEL